MTLGDLLNENAVRYADVDAYRSSDGAISHRILNSRAWQLVSAMAGVGIRQQDRVAILACNRIEFGEVVAACCLSGIVAVPISTRWSVPEIYGALRRVSPGLVFCDSQYAAVIGAAEVDYRVVTFAPGDYDEFLASGAPDTRPMVARPDDVALLLFTSGTTGAAKCCVLGQWEVKRVADVLNAEMRSGRDVNRPGFPGGSGYWISTRVWSLRDAS